jgi:hypothetical protein
MRCAGSQVARQLEAAEGGRLTQAELLEGVKDGLLQEERAGSAVPSVVVAQSCMVGLFRIGVLVPVVEVASCNGSHTYREPHPHEPVKVTKRIYVPLG